MNKTHLLVWAVLPALLACPPAPTPPPEVPASATVKSFSASPTEVQAEESTTLSWEVENANAISLRTVSGKEIPVPEGSLNQGTVQFKVTESTAFVLTAFGEGGNDSSLTSVAVLAKETGPFFTAFPTNIVAGQSATLVWNAPGATSIEVKGAAGESVASGAATSGSIEVKPNFSTTYQLVADGVTLTVAINVEAKIQSFIASPSSVEPGTDINLQWQVGGADKVTLEAEGRAEKIFETTDASEIADGSFSETAPTALPAFGVVRYTLNAHQGDTVSSRALEVYVGAEPQVLAFAYPAFVRENDGATVTWRTALANHVEIDVDGKHVYTSPTQTDVEGGSLFLPGIDAPRTVVFRARNTRGVVVTRTATIAPIGLPVEVAPFTATPAVIAAGGDPVTLTWNVTNARRARVSLRNGATIAELNGVDAELGSVTVYPNKQTEYLLEVDNTVGDALPDATATADVTTPAVIQFNPSKAPAGATVTATHHTVPGNGAVEFIVADFVDISTTGTGVNYDANFDTTAKLINLGRTFQMPLFGQTVGGDKVSVANNGWFFFNGTTVSGPDGPSANFPVLPSDSLEPFAFAPFWADLYSGNNGEIYWQLDGTGAGARLIIQWDRFEIHNAGGSEVTLQAQLYGNGAVVFAYKTMTGIPENLLWSVGLVNGTETGGEFITTRPAFGSAHAFFTSPVTLPAPAPVPGWPMTARIAIGTEHWIDVDVNDVTLPEGQFFVSEVNYNPASGMGEWFELTNSTANPIDLSGWTIDFGAGNTHTISGSLTLPANGILLFGQTADATEASANGPAIDYVYGSNFSMPDASGAVAISFSGGVYTRLAWTSAGTPGRSLGIEVLSTPQPNMRFASTRPTSLTCTGGAPYGSGVQSGSPGTGSRCFPWTLSPTAPNGFTPIALTGTALFSATTVNEFDTVNAQINFVAAGGRAVNIGGALWGNATNPLTVSSNGWVALGSTTSNSSSGAANPSTSAPNSVLALFWDDLSGNAGTAANPSGIYWQQFDPDATPRSGDEYTLISWENWRRYQSATSSNTSNLNFQLKILEAIGDVEYHYGTMQSVLASHSNGADAAAWLESADGSMALTIGSNEVWVQQNSGWKFTYTP